MEIGLDVHAYLLTKQINRSVAEYSSFWNWLRGFHWVTPNRYRQILLMFFFSSFNLYVVLTWRQASIRRTRPKWISRNSVYWALCVECHRLWHQLTLFLARVVAKQVLFVSFIENILIALEYIYWMESWMAPFVKTLSILMRWLTADHILLLQRVLSTHFRLVVISVMSFRSNLAQKCNA